MNPSQTASSSPIKLSVLMPVYNEHSTLAEIVERVQAVPIDKEIIIVDNCSDDGTREILSNWVASGRAVWASNGTEETSTDTGDRLRVYFQVENHGKGSSVRRALSLARGEWVIVQDADLEYDPRDFEKLLNVAQKLRVRKRKPVAVFGSRLWRGTQTRETQPRNSFFFGRIGLSLLFRLLYARPLSDVATCYKLMPRELVQSLDLQGSGFELDFEMAARLARRGVRIHEIPISYAPRTEAEGKKIRVVHDGLRAAWALLKYRFA